jgi:abortive infection bacteriophage resistance protein
MKIFKTYEEQLEILKFRGLNIRNESEAIKILQRENYYSLINGYKDLFQSNKLTEMYIENTAFEEIYALIHLIEN